MKQLLSHLTSVDATYHKWWFSLYKVIILEGHLAVVKKFFNSTKTPVSLVHVEHCGSDYAAEYKRTE